ncbi:MAG: Asp23/Gls24 family envelope stress response protein, partial [Firmicutes bacterium]|nr:Asp23/Gls24 family envelope stress response protein [Bacillota bacterium]
NNINNPIKVKENEIDVHVVVSYGCNIAKAAGDVIGKIRYMVEEQTGIEIENVNVFVDGIRKVSSEDKR